MPKTDQFMRDDLFMRLALKEAEKAACAGEVPIGAVLVDSTGGIVGRGYNIVEQSHRAANHAEMIAISEASEKAQDWRFDGHTLYVTLEPCLMCFGLIAISRIETIVYGARSPLFGCMLDNEDVFQLYKKRLKIRPGILGDECVALLRTFFKKRRSVEEVHEASNRISRRNERNSQNQV